MSHTGSSDPTVIVVMGVSGVGKSTVAGLLAEELGWTMAEADQFHPESNIRKMTTGTPLTDADRIPWLHAIRGRIDEHAGTGQNLVLTCSALKRSYRDLLRRARATVRFVHLTGDTATVSERLLHRTGHFMPPELLRSQLADLEPLASDEDGITVDSTATPERIVHTALATLAIGPQA